MFENREEAGERLADALTRRGVTADVVLAIPRGGLPLGRAVADALGAPLDVVVARKMGAPRNPEFAIGAVAADGSVWLNDDAISRVGVDDSYVAEVREAEAENAAAKAARYRSSDEPPDFEGKTVVVVDDGAATGATATACLRAVADAGTERVVLAVPVAPPKTTARLAREADAVVCVEEPREFRAVGQYYRDFAQVSDEEAMSYLRR
ncbi:MAG: phosphoribosyltransferase [Haloferacaceae archaeon]